MFLFLFLQQGKDNLENKEAQIKAKVLQLLETARRISGVQDPQENQELMNVRSEHHPSGLRSLSLPLSLFLRLFASFLDPFLLFFHTLSSLLPSLPTLPHSYRSSIHFPMSWMKLKREFMSVKHRLTSVWALMKRLLYFYRVWSYILYTCFIHVQKLAMFFPN